MTGRRRRCRCGSWSCVRPGRPRVPASALPHARRARRPGRPRGPAGAPRRSSPGGRARGGPLRLRTFLRRGLACRILAASPLAVEFTLDPQTRPPPARSPGPGPPPSSGGRNRFLAPENLELSSSPDPIPRALNSDLCGSKCQRCRHDSHEGGLLRIILIPQHAGEVMESHPPTAASLAHLISAGRIGGQVSTNAGVISRGRRVHAPCPIGSTTTLFPHQTWRRDDHLRLPLWRRMSAVCKSQHVSVLLREMC